MSYFKIIYVHSVYFLGRLVASAVSAVYWNHLITENVDIIS